MTSEILPQIDRDPIHSSCPRIPECPHYQKQATVQRDANQCVCPNCVCRQELNGGWGWGNNILTVLRMVKEVLTIFILMASIFNNVEMEQHHKALWLLNLPKATVTVTRRDPRSF